MKAQSQNLKGTILLIPLKSLNSVIMGFAVVVLWIDWFLALTGGEKELCTVVHVH